MYISLSMYIYIYIYIYIIYRERERERLVYDHLLIPAAVWASCAASLGSLTSCIIISAIPCMLITITAICKHEQQETKTPQQTHYKDT